MLWNTKDELVLLQPAFGKMNVVGKVEMQLQTGYFWQQNGADRGSECRKTCFVVLHDIEIRMTPDFISFHTLPRSQHA